MSDCGKKGDALSLSFATLHCLPQNRVGVPSKIGRSDVGPSHFNGEIESSVQARGDTFERASEIDRQRDATRIPGATAHVEVGDEFLAVGTMREPIALAEQ